MFSKIVLRRFGALCVCAMFAGALSAAMPAAAQKSGDKSKLGNVPIASLAYVTDVSGAKFEVVDSRFEETGTATVLFGLVGGAINSSINASEDMDKAAPYKEAAAKLEPGRIINDNFGATLTGKAFPLAEGEKGASHALEIEIFEWGLTRTSQRDKRLTTFIRLHVSMKQGKKVIWDTYMKDSGSRAALLQDTTSDMLVEDIQALAAKMGERIAYEIIYR